MVPCVAECAWRVRSPGGCSRFVFEPGSAVALGCGTWLLFERFSARLFKLVWRARIGQWAAAGSFDAFEWLSDQEWSAWMIRGLGEVLVLDKSGEAGLADAIRKVCRAPGVFLRIEVPGLGRAIIIPERSFGEFVAILASEDFAEINSRGAGDFVQATGTVCRARVALDDELLAFREPEIAGSMEEAIRDFHRGCGVVRDAAALPE